MFVGEDSVAKGHRFRSRLGDALEGSAHGKQVILHSQTKSNAKVRDSIVVYGSHQKDGRE